MCSGIVDSADKAGSLAEEEGQIESSTLKAVGIPEGAVDRKADYMG